MSDFLSQLKSVKNNQNAGASSSAQKDATRARLMQAIGHTEKTAIIVEKNAPTFVTYGKWVLHDFISKPLAASVAVFILLAGGSLTTVNAASNSLPGESLYQVKLVAERAQLKFASQEDRALLHTEFAQNRLNEAASLRRVEGEEAEGRVLVAMNAFKQEVESASNGLREMKESGNSETIKVAALLDQNIEQLNTAIEIIDESEVDALTEAKEVTKAASEDLVDVMVETHEDEASDNSARNLSIVFREDVNRVNDRKSYALGRLATVQNALEKNPELSSRLSFGSVDVQREAMLVNRALEQVADAMDRLVVGGFRGAFDILRSVESQLATSESNIAGMEIEIVDVLSAMENEKVEAEEIAAEEQLNNEEIILNPEEDPSA